MTLFGYSANKTGESASATKARVSPVIGMPKVFRAFYGTRALNWPPDGGIWGSIVYVVSWKREPNGTVQGKYNSDLIGFLTKIANWLASQPANVIVVFCAWDHENDSKVAKGNYTLAQSKAAWAHCAQVIRNFGNSRIKTCLLLTGYQPTPRYAQHKPDNLSLLDYFAIDPYQNGMTTAQQAKNQVISCVNVIKSVYPGKGIIIGEFGINSRTDNTSDAVRATVLQGFIDECKKQGVAYVMHFHVDQPDNNWAYGVVPGWPQSAAVLRAAITGSTAPPIVPSPPPGAPAPPPPPPQPTPMAVSNITVTVPDAYQFAGDLTEGVVWFFPTDLTGSGTATPTEDPHWYRYVAAAGGGVLKVTAPTGTELRAWVGSGAPDMDDDDAVGFDDGTDVELVVDLNGGQVALIQVEGSGEIEYTFVADGGSLGLRLDLRPSTVLRTPTVISAGVDGAAPGESLTFAILDGETLGTFNADDAGVLQQVSLLINAQGAGTYTVRVSGSTSGSETATLTILQDTPDRPDPLAPDAAFPLGPLAGPVVKWRFVDPVSGGEAYTFAINPNQMDEPRVDRQLTVMRTTAPRGPALIWQGGDRGKTLSFGGYLDTREQYEAMERFLRLRHRFWLTDNRNRVWSVSLDSFDPVPKRALNTPWAHDYTAQATVYDGPVDIT